jgi:hypothetical protein
MSKLSRSGHGTPGYCKLCSFTDPRDQDEFDRRTGIKENDKYVYTPVALNDWMKTKGIGSATRQTIYEHRKHVMHPKDRIVSVVKKHTLEHGVQPAQVSESQFLDSLISIGQQRISANPDEVTIDQALKATQIKLGSGKRGDASAVLVNIFTSGAPVEARTIIEGESREIL